MVRTSSIYDHFDLYLTSVTLTFNPPEMNVSNGTSPPRGQQLCKIILKPCINAQVMLRRSSIHVFDHFDLYLTPVTLTFNLSKIIFKWHVSSSRARTLPNCFEIHALLYMLWSGQIRTDGRTHIHRTKIVTTIFRLTTCGLDNKIALWEGCKKLGSFDVRHPSVQGQPAGSGMHAVGDLDVNVKWVIFFLPPS